MKDLVITSKRIKNEFRMLVFCFCLSILINIIAIIRYGTAWSEIFSQLHIELLISLIIYAVTVVARIITRAITKMFKPLKN